jgi:copper(I)-binding protein
LFSQGTQTVPQRIEFSGETVMTLRQWTTPFLIAAALSMGLAHAHADAAHVKADAAWARASVPGQQAPGALMRVTGEEPLRLVGGE